MFAVRSDEVRLKNDDQKVDYNTIWLDSFENHMVHIKMTSSLIKLKKIDINPSPRFTARPGFLFTAACELCDSSSGRSRWRQLLRRGVQREVHTIFWWATASLISFKPLFVFWSRWIRKSFFSKKGYACRVVQKKRVELRISFESLWDADPMVSTICCLSAADIGLLNEGTVVSVLQQLISKRQQPNQSPVSPVQWCLGDASDTL